MTAMVLEATSGGQLVVASLRLILVLLALVCLLLAALGITAPRVNLLAAGLFLWLVSTLAT